MYDQQEINKIEKSYNEYKQNNQKLNSFDQLADVNEK